MTMPPQPPQFIRDVAPYSPQETTAEVTFAAPKPAFGIRVADVTALRRDGSRVIGQRKVPMLPIFEQAFAAFAQGTQFKTPSGYIAVEDLQPGDHLINIDGHPEMITLIGSAIYNPGDPSCEVGLIRIMPDSFGMSRPESFLSIGTAARILQTPHDQRYCAASTAMMTPAARFLDGVQVIEITPQVPVRLFHLSLQRHSAIFANGLQVESYHPGSGTDLLPAQTLKNAFLSLFPHVEQLSDFGPARFSRAPETSPEKTGS